MHRAAALAALLVAMSGPFACAGTGSQAPLKGEVEVMVSDGRVGQYVSTGWGFATSTFWIEGPRGVVLIDAQFLPSAAEEAVIAAERVTRKKVVAAIVLHPNPDKFNGTATLQARGIEVLTSSEVLAKIRIREKVIWSPGETVPVAKAPSTLAE